MSVSEQMADGVLRAALVVGDNAVRVKVTRRSVDEYQSCSRSALVVEVRVIVAGRDDDDPVDASLAKRADQLALSLGILIAGAGEDEYSSLSCSILHGPMERRGKRVRHILEDESDRLCFPAEAPERGCVRIPPVIELLD